MYVLYVWMNGWLDGWMDLMVDTRVDKLIARTHYGQWKYGWMDE